MRNEFSDDRTSLLREKRVLEETNATLSRKAQSADENKKEAADLRSRMESLEAETEKLKANMTSEKLSREVAELREKFEAELKENSALSKSVKEQQGVIKTALRRLYPNLEVGEMCPEHQECFDKFVAQMEKKSGDDKKEDEEEEAKK